MRFMMIMFPGPDAEKGLLPNPKLVEAMGKFNEEMVKAGMVLAAEGLHPTSAGARVRFPAGKAQITDGPFSEAKEVVGGFWLIQAKSLDEVKAWASRCPAAVGDMIEIRRVFEAEDFAAIDPTGELREAEARLRDEVEAQQRR